MLQIFSKPASADIVVFLVLCNGHIRSFPPSTNVCLQLFDVIRGEGACVGNGIGCIPPRLILALQVIEYAYKQWLVASNNSWKLNSTLIQLAWLIDWEATMTTPFRFYSLLHVFSSSSGCSFCSCIASDFLKGKAHAFPETELT